LTWFYFRVNDRHRVSGGAAVGRPRPWQATCG
jgi:hypothetical protein